MHPSPQRAPRVETGTRLAESEAQVQQWEEAVAATTVDPALWTGAFATNVWGGRYEMDGVIARGGQGCTFTGTDRMTGARVVAKVLDLKHAADWKRVDLFDREARTLKEIEHPGVPKLLEVLEDKDTGARALMMTLVPGDDLDVVIKRDGPMSEAVLWRVLVDVVDVLRALHGASSPLIHRDIKPKNLVRRPDGGVSVVDFGGVGHVRAGEGSTVVGTFGYMAPEQLYGHASCATDLYALGATLLTLATGVEPEDQPRDGLALDVDKAAPRLSEPMRELLKRLLAPDPGERPKDAVELAKELNAAYDRSKAPRRGRAKEPEEAAASGEGDLETTVDFVAGFVTLMLGVLGTVATVVIGEVLLPVIFTIALAFASGDGKRRLTQAREAVRTGSKVARESFRTTIQSGARQMRGAEARRRQRLPRSRPGSTKRGGRSRARGGR